ncbi:Ger(x)C family spore germination protein [Clostridium sp. LBM24168]
MYKKISILILFIFIASAVLTGCYDSSEVDNQIYPILIGVDKGINNKIFLTIQYPTYSSSQENNGGVQASKGGNINSVEAPSIIEACQLLNMEVSRIVTLKHVKAFVFSEEIAEQGIGEYVASIQRYREMRSTVNIIVTRGRAEDFIKSNQPGIGPSISKMTELLLSQSKHTGYFPQGAFFEFYRNVLSTYEQPIAIYAAVNDFHQIQDKASEKGESPLIPGKGYKPGEVPIKSRNGRQIAGTALFYGDKMVGYLDNYETRYYLMVTGDFKSGIVTIDDPEKKDSPIVTYLTLRRKPIIKSVFENGRPVINIDIKIDADIASIHSRINYEKMNRIDSLNNYLQQFILDGIVNTIKKTQIKYNSDAFGFGHAVSKNFKTIQEWEEYNWSHHYKEAQINVNLDLKIRGTGTKIGSKEVWKTKGRAAD